MSQNPNFNEQLSEEILRGLENTTFEKSFGGEYSGSRLQKETYEKIQQNDLSYQQYINNTFGSYENYAQQKKLNQTISVFDPNIHYMADVTVVTDEVSYKTDHISPDEVIMEALSGICTVIFVKSNGEVRRITGTLEKSMIPTKELQTRSGFFSPMGGDRIGIWDINEQTWKSFYMSKLVKFVRDDTIGLE